MRGGKCWLPRVTLSRRGPGERREDNVLAGGGSPSRWCRDLEGGEAVKRSTHTLYVWPPSQVPGRAVHVMCMSCACHVYTCCVHVMYIHVMCMSCAYHVHDNSGTQKDKHTLLKQFFFQRKIGRKREEKGRERGRERGEERGRMRGTRAIYVLYIQCTCTCTC